MQSAAVQAVQRHQTVVMLATVARDQNRAGQHATNRGSEIMSLYTGRLAELDEQLDQVETEELRLNKQVRDDLQLIERAKVARVRLRRNEVELRSLASQRMVLTNEFKREIKSYEAV